MGQRDAQYTLSGMIELDEGFFSTERDEDEKTKALKRGRGSQKKTKVLVMVESEQVENLKTKEVLCAELEKHTSEGTATREFLKEFEQRFNQIGFVPRKDINIIRNRYQTAVEKFTNAIQGLSDEDRSRLVLENQLIDLKSDPMGSQKIYQKEQAIRKKITKAENDIAVWRNNLEFFGRSKNADKYKDEYNEKISTATDSLKQLKDQLKLLRTVS